MSSEKTLSNDAISWSLQPSCAKTPTVLSVSVAPARLFFTRGTGKMRSALSYLTRDDQVFQELQKHRAKAGISLPTVNRA
jgi:hypothetical protein